METKQRLNTYLRHKHLSLNDFARACKVNPSVLSRIGNTTAESSLRKISENSDLNIEWLINGDGDMTKSVTQSVGNIAADNVCGVNVSGSNIDFNSANAFDALLSVVNKHNAIVSRMQDQIDKLIGILEKKV